MVAEIEEQREHIIIVKGEELDIIEANEYGVNKKIKIKIKIKKHIITN